MRRKTRKTFRLGFQKILIIHQFFRKRLLSTWQRARVYYTKLCDKFQFISYNRSIVLPVQIKFLLILCIFYFIIQSMVKYYNGTLKKCCFFTSFFSKYLKSGWDYFDKKKKIGRNHGLLVYKKALISEHRKNYIFRDIN